MVKLTIWLQTDNEMSNVTFTATGIEGGCDVYYIYCAHSTQTPLHQMEEHHHHTLLWSVSSISLFRVSNCFFEKFQTSNTKDTIDKGKFRNKIRKFSFGWLKRNIWIKESSEESYEEYIYPLGSVFSIKISRIMTYLRAIYVTLS